MGLARGHTYIYSGTPVRIAFEDSTKNFNRFLKESPRHVCNILSSGIPLRIPVGVPFGILTNRISLSTGIPQEILTEEFSRISSDILPGSPVFPDRFMVFGRDSINTSSRHFLRYPIGISPRGFPGVFLTMSKVLRERSSPEIPPEIPPEIYP